MKTAREIAARVWCDKVQEHPDGEKGHQWEYDKWDGWCCRYCGIQRKCTKYEEGYHYE